MIKHRIDFDAGQATMRFEGKPILKGAFASMVILSNDVTRQVTHHPTQTEWYIDDFLYRLSHVMDREGNSYDVIVSLKDGKILHYFAMSGWLLADQRLGRQLIALRFIQYYAANAEVKALISAEVVKRVQHLENTTSGQLRCQAKLALQAINGEHIDLVASGGQSLSRVDPLSVLDLQGPSDYLKLGEKLIKKGSVASFLKSLRAMSLSVPGSITYCDAMQDAKNTVTHLVALGFFEFFSSANEWREAAHTNPAMWNFYQSYRVATAP